MNKWINIKQVLVGSSQNVLAKARTITFRLAILISNVDYEHPMCKEESQFNFDYGRNFFSVFNFVCTMLYICLTK
jgi:hypothetical protein